MLNKKPNWLDYANFIIALIVAAKGFYEACTLYPDVSTSAMALFLGSFASWLAWLNGRKIFAPNTGKTKAGN